MKSTHLLAGTGVEGHYDLVHERDVEVPGEVENALRDVGGDEQQAMHDDDENVPPWWPV